MNNFRQDEPQEGFNAGSRARGYSSSKPEPPPPPQHHSMSPAVQAFGQDPSQTALESTPDQIASEPNFYTSQKRSPKLKEVVDGLEEDMASNQEHGNKNTAWLLLLLLILTLAGLAISFYSPIGG